MPKIVAPLGPKLHEAIEKFRRWGDKYMEREHEVPTAPLYHYTDGRGLKGILESGRVWFTDYRHMNDPSELKHGIETAHEVARELSSRSDDYVRSFLKHFTDLLHDDNFTGKVEFFITCFSYARNDLGQWRAYADNGRGFAIGFSPKMFSIRDHLPDRPDEFLGSVRYKVGKVLERHRTALGEAVAIFSDAMNANADLLHDDAVRLRFMEEFVREIMAQPLIWNCLTSKHPASEHEQEVRLVILGTRSALADYVKTRLRGSEIVPYIDQPMPVLEPNNIAEIVVGPAAHADADRTVRTLLKSVGIDPDNIAVRRSDIPYRAL